MSLVNCQLFLACPESAEGSLANCYFFHFHSSIPMKQILTSLVMILLVKGYVAAQSTVNIRERIRFKDTVLVDKYQIQETTFSVLKLKMNPGDYRIQNLKDLDKIKGMAIVSVNLVYSDYPVGEDFSELNRKRILELYMHLPDAFATMSEWRIVKQTGVAQTGGIQNYFHGIVVYFRPMPTYAQENEVISDIVEGKVAPKDSTLLKVFGRKKEWKDMLVVADVTGSMSPYTAQLLLWIKANQTMKTFKQIIFFNDDDEKSTNQMGKLDESGIWDIESGNSKKVIEKAFEAMSNGQHIENNLEAICYAIQKYPENKQKVVMIADNWEDPCDMHLLEFLKKEKIPVRIIICGVTDRLNTKYLDIAYATGGSVHTMEEDLEQLAKLGDGKSFKLNGLKFKMVNGSFVQEK